MPGQHTPSAGVIEYVSDSEKWPGLPVMEVNPWRLFPTKLPSFFIGGRGRGGGGWCVTGKNGYFFRCIPLFPDFFTYSTKRDTT